MAQNSMQIVIQAKDLASREFQKLERSIRNVQKESKAAGKGAKDAGADFEEMGKKVATTVAAIAGMGAAAIQMANMGEAVRNTANRFEDLAGGAQEAQASLERMRTLTRNIADDQSLMQGASDLLLMGIAGTTREAESIVELAVGLKRSTDTVADAINNFSIMLGNQAYLRLDSFGISAGRTRLRVEELLASGEALTREDAFRMAVLEIGADTMERTIDSIDRTSTAFSRLKSDMQNFAAETGELMFNWANDISATLELATTDSGSQRFEDIVANYNRTAQRAILENGRTMTQAQREMLQTILDFGPEAIGTGIVMPVVEPWNQWLLSSENAQGVTRKQINELKPLMAEYFNIPLAAVRELDFDEITELLERTLSPDYQRLIQEQERYQQDRARIAAESAAEEQRVVNENLRLTRLNVRQFNDEIAAYGTMDMFGKLEQFDLTRVDELLEIAAEVNEYYNLVAENSDMISQQDFDNVTELRNEVNKTAQDALRLQEAFTRLSLVDVLGGAPTRLQSDVIGLLSSVLPDEVADSVEEKALRLVGATSAVSEVIEDTLTPAFERAGDVLSEDRLADNIRAVNDVIKDLATGAIDSATAIERLTRIAGTLDGLTTAVINDPAFAARGGIFSDDVLNRAMKAEDYWRDTFRTMRTGARETYGDMERLFEQGQVSGGFFNTQVLQEMEIGYQQLVRYVDHLANSDLVSEESKDRMSEMLDDSAAMLQLAREGAAAVKSASLSQLMGETGDASASELASIIASGIFNPESAAGFTQSMDRLTGARTATTDYIENELAPLTQAIIARFGEEAGAQFAYNINQALETGMALGLDPRAMVQQIKNSLGVTFSEANAREVFIPAMATWADVFGGEDGLGRLPKMVKNEAGEMVQEVDEWGRLVWRSADDTIRSLEAQLGLEYGTIDLSKAIANTLGGADLTFADLAAVSPLAAEELMAKLFTDGEVDLDAPLRVNLPNVGVGRIMAMTGFTKQEIMSQLTAQGEDFHYDPVTDSLWISPGTFRFVPFGTAETPPDFLRQGSIENTMNFLATAGDPIQRALDNSFGLVTNMQNFGAVDLSETQAQLDTTNTTVTSIYDTTKLLTETVWTLVIDVQVNEPEYSSVLEAAVGRINRDNGGRSPGTIYNPVNGR